MPRIVIAIFISSFAALGFASTAMASTLTNKAPAARRGKDFLRRNSKVAHKQLSVALPAIVSRLNESAGENNG